MTCPLQIERHPIADKFQTWMKDKGYIDTFSKRCGLVATEVCKAYPDLDELPKDVDNVIRKIR